MPYWSLIWLTRENRYAERFHLGFLWILRVFKFTADTERRCSINSLRIGDLILLNDLWRVTLRTSKSSQLLPFMVQTRATYRSCCTVRSFQTFLDSKRRPFSPVTCLFLRRWPTRQIVNRFPRRFLGPKYSAFLGPKYSAIGSERQRLHLKLACHQNASGPLDAGSAQRTNCTFIPVRHPPMQAFWLVMLSLWVMSSWWMFVLFWFLFVQHSYKAALLLMKKNFPFIVLSGLRFGVGLVPFFRVISFIPRSQHSERPP